MKILGDNGCGKKPPLLRGLEPWFVILLDETMKYWQHDPHAKDWAERGIRGMFTNS